MVASPLLGQNFASNFVIDKSKPFAYVVFDHFEKQKPQYEGDDPKRLILRVVNNCNIPLRFMVADSNLGSGYLVEHGVMAAGDYSDIPEMPMSPEEARNYQRDRESALKHMPKGQWFHLGGGTLPLEPGKSILINIPRNHVSEYWFIRISFDFVLEPDPNGNRPSMYLTFTESDIPFNKR
jgi:hypothetical protein